MLKIAIYCNVFVLFIISIILLNKISDEKNNLEEINILKNLHMIFNFISFCFSKSEIVGWDAIVLLPISIITFIIHMIISLNIEPKIKKINNTNYNNLSIKKYINLIIIPIINLVLIILMLLL